MRNPLYINQLKRDLERWISEGLVEARHREAILASAGGGVLSASLPTLLATLGVILIGAGAMAFIAANWTAMPKFLQLTLLFGAMAAAYAIAAALFARGRQTLAQAMVLLGVALFGVNIMLIAQIYHINAHYPDGVLIWALGALAAAVLVPSRPALGAAIVIGATWSATEILEFETALHWPFFAFLIATFLIAEALKWRAGFHLSFLALIGWLTLSSDGLMTLLGLEWADLASLYALVWLAGFAKGNLAAHLGFARGRALAHYGILLASMSIFVLQWAEGPAADGFWPALVVVLGLIAAGFALGAFFFGRWRAGDVAGFLLAALFAALWPLALPEENATVALQWLASAGVLAFFIWVVMMGAAREDRFVVNTGILGVGIQTLYIYFVNFNEARDYLGDAVFFVIGGALLIALSVALERVRRRLMTPDHPEAAS